MEAMKNASPEAEEIEDHHSSILQQVLVPPPTLDFL